jgi:hypothetical protein
MCPATDWPEMGCSPSLRAGTRVRAGWATVTTCPPLSGLSLPLLNNSAIYHPSPESQKKPSLGTTTLPELVTLITRGAETNSSGWDGGRRGEELFISSSSTSILLRREEQQEEAGSDQRDEQRQKTHRGRREEGGGGAHGQLSPDPSSVSLLAVE